MAVSSDDLVLYTHPRSRGRVVRWMLEEIGRPYRTEVIEYGPAMKAPSFLAINPMGKVPALRHGDVVVTETPAVCAYLAEVFPDAQLTPAKGDRAAWAAYHRWMYFCAGPLESALINKALGVVVADDKRAMVGYGSFDDALRVLTQAVADKVYIAGDHFTAADLYVASHISFGLRFGMIPSDPALERYVALHKSRPAALRAEEIDNALLAGA